MRVSVLLKAIGSVTLVALAGCGKRTLTRPVPVLPLECKIVPGPVERTDSITVALLDAVDPGHAPRARNSSERILFTHLYETLITVNCLGEAQAGLAEAWQRGKGGRRWTFELRQGAQFWDGTPVTARDVVKSWPHAAVEFMTPSAGIDSATVAGDRVLHVYFEKSHRSVPRVLSSPVFAVAKPSRDSHWPLGSGYYRIETLEKGSGGTSNHKALVHTAFGSEGPVIRFIETSIHETRDLLEGEIDVMVTCDPTVIDYAASRPQLLTGALPWDRTYVLLSTTRVQELKRGGKVGTISSDLSDGLAQDAVRSDARGYRPPSWWEDLRGCGELSNAVSRYAAVPQGADSLSGLRRVLYDLDDPVARDLAGRIVALATSSPALSPGTADITSAIPGLTNDRLGIIAEGVTQRELNSSLRSGDDFAYVVPVPRRPPDPCYEARKLMNRAHWLAALEDDFPDALIPLVDTRLHVIANRNRVELIVDWYGNILLMNGISMER